MFSVIGLEEAHEATQIWNHGTTAPNRTTSERTSKWVEPAKNILKRNDDTNHPDDTEQIPYGHIQLGWEWADPDLALVLAPMASRPI